MIRKFFSHSVVYGLAPQIGSIAGIFALPIITKDLTDTDFGVWGVIMAYVGSLTALRNLGLGVVLSNSIIKKPEKHQRVWRQLYGFLYLWQIPFSILLGAVLWFVIPSEAIGNRILLITGLLLPGLLFGPTFILGTYYYQLKQLPKPIAIRTSLFALLTVALNVLFISQMKLGYMGWFWSQFIVVLLSSASYWIPLQRMGYSPKFNFKWRRIRRSLAVGLPTVPHSYAGFLLNSSDRIVLDGLQVGIGDLGEYSLASKFGNYFRILSGAGNRAVSPMILDCYKNEKETDARKLIFVFQIAVLLGTGLFCLWAREIFQILIRNDSLVEVYPLAIIIVMAYNYRPMYVGAMNKLFYDEKTHLLWQVSFIAGFGNVIMNLIFVPMFGFEAAAYTTFVSLMYMGFAGHFVKKIRAVHSISYYPVTWLFLIVLLSIAVYLLRDISIFAKGIASVFAIIGLIAMAFSYRTKILSFKTNV